jgi:hypothetical protein
MRDELQIDPAMSPLYGPIAAPFQFHLLSLPAPTQSGHRFQSIPVSDSEAKRSPIPRESGHFGRVVGMSDRNESESSVEVGLTLRGKERGCQKRGHRCARFEKY